MAVTKPAKVAAKQIIAIIIAAKFSNPSPLLLLATIILFVIMIKLIIAGVYLINFIFLKNLLRLYVIKVETNIVTTIAPNNLII